MNHQLKHGYTLTDLHTLAKLAVHTARASASDWHERYDTAYSGIAEELYAAEHWPQRHQLVRAGQLAIYAAVDGHMQAHGYYRRKTDGTTHGPGSSPAWRAYWLDLTRPGRSPEGRVVERTALAKILPRLAPRHQDALLALAVHDDYRTAAAALGVRYVTFCDHIAKARRHFYRLWHEGETPSRIWGTDRRAGSTSGAKPARVRGTAGHLAVRRRRAAQTRRNFARLSIHPYLRSPEYDADGKPSGAHQKATLDFARDCELAWTQFTAAYLLRESGPSGIPKNKIADALRRDYGSGERAAETLTDWLDGYGINPELILAALLGPAGIQPRGGAR